MVSDTDFRMVIIDCRSRCGSMGVYGLCDISFEQEQHMIPIQHALYLPVQVLLQSNFNGSVEIVENAWRMLRGYKLDVS